MGSQEIALAPDHEARVQGVAVGTGRGAFILIRHFRGTDSRLGRRLKARKGEDKGTPGAKCDGTERVGRALRGGKEETALTGKLALFWTCQLREAAGNRMGIFLLTCKKKKALRRPTLRKPAGSPWEVGDLQEG